VRLVVRDNGGGLDGSAEGAGIAGMSERALHVGGRLTIASNGGTEVRLDIPLPGNGR
jgi:two-component system sensor histidine kinase UhpB